MSPTKSFPPFAALLLLLVLSPLLLSKTYAYPILTDADALSAKCFNFNVPDDDDAHMVFIAIPNHNDDEVEEWFTTQMHELTRKGSGSFMQQLPEVSKQIHERISDDEYNGRSNVYLELTVPKRPVLRHQMFMWYAPVVVTNVVKASQRGQKKGKNTQPPGGYSVCFENKNKDESVTILFDVVLMSDEGQDEELHASPPFFVSAQK